jgi:alpha-L-fucosidase
MVTPIQKRLEWFNQARFGMFIHWGLYSLLGRGEWVRYQEGIPAAEYATLAQQFNPRHFRPAEWAALAKSAGMKYMVLTTKHHDGFCLFDSQYTDFNAAESAAGRDLVREYVEACRAAGLGVGLYYSVKDWTFPAYFHDPATNPEGWAKLVDHFHNQTLELMRNYGKIDILWFDGDDDPNYRDWGADKKRLWRSEALMAQIRQFQPDIIINNRAGLPEDFETPEQHVPAAAGSSRMYESCITMNNHWGYCPADTDWKSTYQLLSMLVASAARGANFLLNVGPDADGVIPLPSVTRLREIGHWLERHGEAIYGTERILPNWWDVPGVGRITTKGNHAYLVIQDWHPNGEVTITSLANQVQSAELLATGQSLNVTRNGRRLIISGLPIHPPSPHLNVIRLVLEGHPQAQFFYDAPFAER